MRRVRLLAVLVLAVLVLAGCPTEPQRTFFTGLAPAPFQGVWTADGTPRPVGLVVYETPNGPAWSPHGLVLASAGAYLRHDCRDFQVDPTSGAVAAAVGINPLGGVSDAGALGWLDTLDAGLAGKLRYNLASGHVFASPTAVGTVGSDVFLDGGLERTAQDELVLHLEVAWVGPALAGDAGSPVIEIEGERLVLHRRLACP